jgi:phage FluMu protein Com
MPDNESVIERLKLWQTSGIFHPYTCGNCSSDQVLDPVEIDGKVVMKCPKCDYVQEKIIVPPENLAEIIAKTKAISRLV